MQREHIQAASADFEQQPAVSRIPASYLPATFRNSLPFDLETKRIGIGFDLELGGGVARFALSVIGVRDLIAELQAALAQAEELGEATELARLAPTPQGPR